MGRRWSRIPVALLGTMPDAEIARRHGCSPTAVGTRRRRLGIPAAPTRLDSIPERAGGVLGEYTDATAAVILGVSEHTARRWRIRLGREAAGSDLWASIPRGARCCGLRPRPGAVARPRGPRHRRHLAEVAPPRPGEAGEAPHADRPAGSTVDLRLLAGRMSGYGFTVPGDAVPKGRPRTARIGGRTITRTPSRTKNYEAVIKACAAGQAPPSPLEGPLRGDHSRGQTTTEAPEPQARPGRSHALRHAAGRRQHCEGGARRARRMVVERRRPGLRTPRDEDVRGEGRSAEPGGAR